jgi:predicted phage-related endonuclease
MSGLTLEQLAERKKGIGGSDAGRVMSGDWASLWREKTGRAEPEDLSGILAVQMGTCTEDLNHRWFERVTGREVLERSMPFVSADYPFMRMNADGITTTKQGHPAYWDAKHVGRLDEATVLRYTPQMTHCCTILGLDWWVLSVFIGNGKHEIVEQSIDPLFQASLIAISAGAVLRRDRRRGQAARDHPQGDGGACAGRCGSRSIWTCPVKAGWQGHANIPNEGG